MIKEGGIWTTTEAPQAEVGEIGSLITPFSTYIDKKLSSNFGRPTRRDPVNSIGQRG